jgi:quercetin dioxygenase-like cupin family protein
VPLDIRRFGVGHRRPDGPPGTTGIEGQVIHGGETGTIAELSFGRHARIVPHSNPNTTYFIVIEGGGWVAVGDERTRVQAGEAVVWPPGIPHAAWTDGTQMRAIAVELPEPPRALPPVIRGRAREVAPGTSKRPVARGEGRLAPKPVDPTEPRDPEATEGEPL